MKSNKELENKNKNPKKDLLIIGGGAAGMMAAISAARAGARVTLLERNNRVGRKILATGNGRCNFSNIGTDISHFSGQNPKFAWSALGNFSVEETIEFFEDLGIAHKVEAEGKVFPMSDQASSILDVLLYELNNLGINLVTDVLIKQVYKKGDSFTALSEDGQSFTGQTLIIATGGKAMPASGSDGSGYELAGSFGHQVTELFPALVQLMLEGPYFKRLEGVKFPGRAQLLSKGKVLFVDEGDILFTNYGISGPPILQISRRAGQLLLEKKEAILKVNILSSLSREQVADQLKRRFRSGGRKTAEESLIGLINKRLIPVILLEAGLSDLKKPAGQISTAEEERILDLLQEWTFEIKGTRSWPNAQVTAGGIRTKEINQKNMESKIVPGLFFAGEIIDIDGLCGGYNLQWAWSSGWIAGQEAARGKI